MILNCEMKKNGLFLKYHYLLIYSLIGAGEVQMPEKEFPLLG